MNLPRRVADISNWEILIDRVTREEDSIGFDTESFGPTLTKLEKGKPKSKGLNLQESHLAGYSIAFPDEAWYVPVEHRRHNLARPLAIQILQAVRHTKCPVWAHLWKHDYQATLPFYEVPTFSSNARCSLLAAWMSGETRLGLKYLAKQILDRESPTYDEATKGRGFNELDPTDAMTLRYTTDDAINTMQLGDHFWGVLNKTDQLSAFVNQEMPFVEVMARMEMRGMAVDVPALNRKAVTLGEQMYKLEWEWDFLLPGVSISSPAQVGTALLDGGHWPERISSRSEKTGKWKVDKDVVKAAIAACKPGTLGHMAAELRQEYQAAAKNRNTYTLPLTHLSGQYRDGRIHPTWNQHITATGRLSCELPNFQNIPVRSATGREIKSCFVPSSGNVFVSADYSQIELRLLAHLVGKGRLFDAYIEGRDVHQQTADLMGCSRMDGKTGNFAKVYGAGPKRLANSMGCTKSEAKAFIQEYDKAYPELVELRDRIVAATRRRGWVRTYSGRRRYITGFQDNDILLRWSAERKANNTPAQGGAADIVKLGMIALSKRGYWPICQVHDEVLLEVPEEQAEEASHVLRDSLENAVNLRVPLVADPAIGQNWGECK